MKWFTNYDTVTALASWLIEKNKLGDRYEVLAFFEKPWKWEEEYTENMNEDKYNMGKINDEI